MALQRTLNMARQRQKASVARIVRPADEPRGPDNTVEEFRCDPTAECRWWNALPHEQRLAFIDGAKGPRDCAASDWLDIGETNRYRILDAAHAVECWLGAVQTRKAG